MNEEIFNLLLTYLRSHEKIIREFAVCMHHQVQENAALAVWSFCHGLIVRRVLSLAFEFEISHSEVSNLATKAIDAFIAQAGKSTSS